MEETLETKKTPSVGEKNFDALRVQITFDYYKQQREEFMSLRSQRASLSLQMVIIMGALVAAFFQASTMILKLVVAALIIVLGIIGFFLLRSMEISMNSYVERARAARKSLGFLEEFASSATKFGNPSFSFFIIYLLIVVVGVVFIFTLILK